VKSEAHAGTKVYSDMGVGGSIGTNGAEGHAGAIAGSCAEVGASTTIGSDRNNAALGAKVSVGPQIGAKVGGGAVSEDGKLTVGADVKLALGVGITSITQHHSGYTTCGECSEGSCQTSCGGGDTHGNSSEQHSQEGGQCS
jgi:hypothetical protein